MLITQTRLYFTTFKRAKGRVMLFEYEKLQKKKKKKKSPPGGKKSL